jgi:hypothetical protein
MKTIREATVAKSVVRLLKTDAGYTGMVFGPKARFGPFEGDDPDAVWRRCVAEVGKAHPSYFGFDGARTRFLKYFPQGFADPGYLAHERDYKDKAIARIGEMLPIEAARTAGPQQRLAAVKAFQATNLVYPIEKSRLKDVLTGETGPAFVQAAARFADGDLAGGLQDMLAAIRATGQPSWPMLTYLPFIWSPDRHLFLKPVVTCDFADRVGHSFGRDYAEGITPHVYESLLDLAAETRREVADLQPRDLIDVQSFIWVVGAYKDDEVISGRPA